MYTPPKTTVNNTASRQAGRQAGSRDSSTRTRGPRALEQTKTTFLFRRPYRRRLPDRTTKRLLHRGGRKRGGCADVQFCDFIYTAYLCRGKFPRRRLPTNDVYRRLSPSIAKSNRRSALGSERRCARELIRKRRNLNPELRALFGDEMFSVAGSLVYGFYL